MVIIRLKGGMGNQMFQYALYKKFKSLGTKARLDVSEIQTEMKKINRCTIFDAFILKDYHDSKSANGLLDHLYIMKVFKKLLRIVHKYYNEKESGIFEDKIYETKSIYLDGYWQSEKYFTDCREGLLEDFCLKNELDSDNQKILKMIKDSDNTVSVHVRLGDYASEDSQRIYGNICTETYYENAFKYYENKYKNPLFFVFSNEPESVKTKFSQHNIIIVDINKENTGWADMYLMSQCDHNIIANSSFSWWAAWLNENHSKEVIAPKIWMNTKRMLDICPKDWIRI